MESVLGIDGPRVNDEGRSLPYYLSLISIMCTFSFQENSFSVESTELLAEHIQVALHKVIHLHFCFAVRLPMCTVTNQLKDLNSEQEDLYSHQGGRMATRSALLQRYVVKDHLLSKSIF